MPSNWNHMVVCRLSDWIISLTNTHLRFIHVFSWPHRSLLLSLYNTSLYWRARVCSSTYLLKSTLFFSGFRWFWVKLLSTFTFRFLCGHTFWIHLSKYLPKKQNKILLHLQFPKMIVLGKNSNPISVFCRWLGWIGTQQILNVFNVRKEGHIVGKQLTAREPKETGYRG